MIDIMVEVFVNLFQSCMFIGFLFLFFDKPKNKVFNTISLCSTIIVFLLLICLSIIVVSVIMWVLIKRISKDNEIKNKLLLSEQREQLYEENLLQTNRQIEKISKIKHDMKNNLMCIEKLISAGRTKEARSLCSDVLGDLSSVYIPINTENPLLNAIINVELEKAVSNGISFKMKINDDLKALRHTSDVVSIIGNLCDNAIEYLVNVPDNDRKMYLEVSVENTYYIITCKNRIISSVLGENPLLQSQKDDSDFHGKGTEIIREISKKYDGDVRIYEEDDFFCSSVILEMPSLPEKV